MTVNERQDCPKLTLSQPPRHSARLGPDTFVTHSCLSAAVESAVDRLGGGRADLCAKAAAGHLSVDDRGLERELNDDRSYSMRLPNEWLPEFPFHTRARLRARGLFGGPTLHAFWDFRVQFADTNDCVLVLSWTTPSRGWPSLRAVTARGLAAPTAWSIGIRSCGWSLRTAGTVHVRWVS